MRELLAPADLDAALAELPGVSRWASDSLVVRVEAPGFPAAVTLLDAVARTAEELDHHPDVDLRHRRLTFTLTTHSAGGVTGLDVELARRILAHADTTDARRLPPPGRVEIVIDADDPTAVAAFWRTGLGYVERPDGEGGVELRHPDGAGPVIWFQRMSPPRTGRGRLHLDVYVPLAAAQERVTATLAAGGTLVTDEYAPRWWVLADTEGNELCVCVP